MTADPTNANDEIREGDSQVHKLPQDNATPFSPPTDPIDGTTADLDDRTQRGRLDPTHPATDSAGNIDQQELYDEGLSGAAEAEEPDTGK